MLKKTGFSCLGIGLLFGLNACSPIASNIPKNFAHAQPPAQQNTDGPQKTASLDNLLQPTRIRIMNFQTYLVSSSVEPALPAPTQPSSSDSSTIDYALKPEQIREFLTDGVLRLHPEPGQNTLTDLEKAEVGEIEIRLSLRPEEILKETAAERSPLKGLRVILKYEPETKADGKEGAQAASQPRSPHSPWVIVLTRRHKEGLLPRLRQLLTGIRIKAVTESQIQDFKKLSTL